MDNKKGSGVAVAAVLIAGAVIFGAPAVGSFARHLDNVQHAVGPSEAGQRAAEEATFENLCPSKWRDATWFQKHTKFRKYSWCEDYVDRL